MGKGGNRGTAKYKVGGPEETPQEKSEVPGEQLAQGLPGYPETPGVQMAPR